MYRIMLNNLKNYANDFNQNTQDPRYKPITFLHLIENMQDYSYHKNANTNDYRKLSSFLWSIRDCADSEQILLELSNLGVQGVQGDTLNYDFTETYRIWKQFLKKAYWRD